MNIKKKIRIIITTVFIIFLLVFLSSFAFFILRLKPRIDLCLTVWNALSGFAGDSTSFRVELDSGELISMRLDEDSLSLSVLTSGDKSKKINMGYVQEGMWFSLSDNPAEYLLPWTEDVSTQIDNSALVSLLNLSEDQKGFIAEYLKKTRLAVYEDDVYDFNPTFINKILGLSCLKADILDFYKNIDFGKKVSAKLDTSFGEINCTRTDVFVPEEYVKLLLMTDGAGSFLNKLGNVLGDAYLKVYIYDDSLVRLDIESVVKAVPSIGLNDLLNGEGLMKAVEFKDRDVNVCLVFEDNNIIADITIEGDISSYNKKATFTADSGEEIITFDEAESINIFKMGRLKLLLEISKIKDYLTN